MKKLEHRFFQNPQYSNIHNSVYKLKFYKYKEIPLETEKWTLSFDRVQMFLLYLLF